MDSSPSTFNAQMRELTEANLPAAVEIEAASYPEDEAASPENMRFRRANAGDFFLEATLKGVSELLSLGFEKFVRTNSFCTSFFPTYRTPTMARCNNALTTRLIPRCNAELLYPLFFFPPSLELLFSSLETLER